MAIVLISVCNGMPELVAWAAEENHRVIEAYDSGETMQQVLRHHPDVIILADGAEPVEGVDLLPVIRGLTASAIIVVGDGDPTSMAKALFEGADAYLKYPIDGSEYRSRVRALLRRPAVKRQTNGFHQFSRVALSMAVASAPAMSSLELRLFTRLYEQSGAMVPTEQLLWDVWGIGGKGASLRFYIHRLCTKLESSKLFRIMNQKGLGYRLEPYGPTASDGVA